MSIKLERLEHIFVKEISNIIKEEVKDKEVGFVTVTSVKITNDLSFAKVYITVLENDKKEQTQKALNRASKFITIKLSQRVEIRKMPELSFVYDESIEYGNKIEDIIEKIEGEE